MLIQRAGSGTLPPPGLTAPPWAALKAQWAQIPPPSERVVALGPAKVVIGHDDSEADDLATELADTVSTHELGWDNESPERTVDVQRFKIDVRPATNGEFYAFWKAQRGTDGEIEWPASWVCDEAGGAVSVSSLVVEMYVPFTNERTAGN